MSMLRPHFKSGKLFLALLGFGYTIPLMYLFVVFLLASLSIEEFTGDPIYLPFGEHHRDGPKVSSSLLGSAVVGSNKARFR